MMRRKARPYCVGRCWIHLLRCPSQLIFTAYPYCTLTAYLYWKEGRCRPVIQISLAYLCWIEGLCRPVIQIFIAYMYCISHLPIFTAYPCCLCLLHIFILHICIAHVHCICLLCECLICIASMCSISEMHNVCPLHI